MKRTAFVSILFTLCATTASAQTMDSAPSSAASTSGGNGFGSGVMSLSLGIPGGGNPYASGTFGLWYGLGADMNLGINVGLGIDTAPDEDVMNILLAPALKYYLRPGAEVSPFILGQINLGFTNQGDDAVDFGILGGFGVEWWVTPVFSIAGYTGAGLDLLRPNDTEPFRFGTFTSGLSAQMYF